MSNASTITFTNSAPATSRPRSASTAALVIAALVVPLSGCWFTAKEGQQMQEAAKARDSRIAQLEEQSRQSESALAGKIHELQELLDRATKVLKRSSADAGAQVETLIEQQASTDGKIAELQHGLQQLIREAAEKRAALEAQLAQLVSSNGDGKVAAAEIPESPGEHFAVAYDAYQKADFKRARALFRSFLERHATHTKAGNAQYWIGASFTQEDKPATALGEYRKVIANHGSSSAADVALYGMGDAFYRLHACTDARDALLALKKRKPSKALQERVGALLEIIAKASDGYCTS